MANKSTKQNKALTYPCIVNVCLAMGQKRKTEVIRALDRVSGEDLSKSIVYPTLRNAFYAKVDLVKETIDSKWVRISKQDAEAREISANGEVTAIAELPPPAPKPAKVKKEKVAKKPAKKAKKDAAPATPTAKKGKVKISKTAKITREDGEPTADQIMEEEARMAALAEDTMDNSTYEDHIEA